MCCCDPPFWSVSSWIVSFPFQFDIFRLFKPRGHSPSKKYPRFSSQQLATFQVDVFPLRINVDPSDVLRILDWSITPLQFPKFFLNLLFAIPCTSSSLLLSMTFKRSGAVFPSTCICIDKIEELLLAVVYLYFWQCPSWWICNKYIGSLDFLSLKIIQYFPLWVFDQF